MISVVRWLAVVGLLLPWGLQGAVRLGTDVLADSGFSILAGKRIGLITNPSGVNRRLQPTLEVLRKARGVRLVALFSAEHGLYGNVPAGQEIRSHVDNRIGLPVYSLYGPGRVRKPTASMLKGLDALVYDIQDTGCRSYTFISTLGLAMEACADAGIEFVVLDRPNPLGGERVEGPVLDPRFRSFVGQWEIPYVYGLTCGELARLIKGERWIAKPCRLTVVRMQGWRRDMAWRDTGLRWIPTSPHIPRGDSPLHYVSTGLLGSVGGVNIGLGFKMPFECVTAPWLDASRFSQQLNRYGLKGVKFEPFSIAYNGNRQKGVRIRFTDPAHAPLAAINFYLLEATQRLTGRDLCAEAVKAGKSFDLFDKVCGTDATRRALAAGKSATSIVASWKPGEEAFLKRRQKYLLY